MSTQTWHISRRTMLKGVGVSMALPLLDAMAPGIARAQETPAAGSSAAPVAPGAAPVRMACLYMPNGVNADAWNPKGTGPGFELSRTLAPLAPHKSELLVLSELWNAGADTGDGHYVKTAGFLTGTTITKTTGKDLRSGGVSLDQLVAQRVGKHTPLPSLELGIEPVTTAMCSTPRARRCATCSCRCSRSPAAPPSGSGTARGSCRG